MPILNQKEICDKWLKNKTINPTTSRKIKENGPKYKQLQKICSLNPLNQKEICDKWLKNKSINPETFRKIKENGPKYKQLQKLCSLNPLNMQKIYKLFVPYIKRTSINIIDRINYYIIIKRYLLSIKEKNNCMKLYNYDPITKKIIYKIGKNIILDKEIGTQGGHGIVYLSHFKSNIKYGTKFDRLNKFAVKITNQGKENKNELEILKELTKKVMEFKCPHFPINYGSLKCINNVNDNVNVNVNDNENDDYSIVKDMQNNNKNFPKLINKNKKLLIQINELAAGDLNDYLKDHKDIMNTYVQIFLSILFFNICINAFHADIHIGNFLYHKIKPGGYLHYNIYGKDYYLENQGYLWVVWDFGLIEPFQNSKEINNNKFGNIYTEEPITYDYNNIFRMFDWAEDYLSEDIINLNKLLSKNIINKFKKEFDFNLHKQLTIEILDFLLENVSSFTTIKPSIIINKTPYIIR